MRIICHGQVLVQNLSALHIEIDGVIRVRISMNDSIIRVNYSLSAFNQVQVDISKTMSKIRKSNPFWDCVRELYFSFLFSFRICCLRLGGLIC
jgi:hypothetical protein